MHYSVSFENNSLKIHPETATSTPESSSSSRLREMVTKALREDASLPIDLETLNFEPGEMRISLKQFSFSVLYLI